MRPSVSTVASVGLGVPAATVIAWVLEVFLGIAMPGSVEAAVGALIAGLIGYPFLGGRASDTEG